MSSLIRCIHLALAGLVVGLGAVSAVEAAGSTPLLPAICTDEALLATVKEDGQNLGLGDLPTRVFRTTSGLYYVPLESERSAILALASSAAMSKAIAPACVKRAEIMFRQALGRVPSAQERLVAARLGPRDGASLIRLAAASPERVAAHELPEAAQRLRRHFFSGDRLRTLAQAYQSLASAGPPPDHDSRTIEPAPKPARTDNALASRAPRARPAPSSPALRGPLEAGNPEFAGMPAGRVVTGPIGRR